MTQKSIKIPSSKTKFPQTIAEHKRVFAELGKLYEGFYNQSQKSDFLCGCTWWSLPPKMWRIAKALGFENDEFNHELAFNNILSGYGDYSASKVAQEKSLEKLREKYPNNILLQNLSSGGRLD